MPRYFIDTQDGEQCIRDEDGVDLPGLREACDEAVHILPSIAHDLLSGGDPPFRAGPLDFVATVKDEHGQPLFRATFSLDAQWLGSCAASAQCSPDQCSPEPEAASNNRPKPEPSAPLQTAQRTRRTGRLRAGTSASAAPSRSRRG